MAILHSARLDLSSEKRAQADLEAILKADGLPYRREVALSSRDVVDFLVGDVAIELKLRGARKKDVYRQLCRYCAHDEVAAIVLVSGLSMGLPLAIGGKPVYLIRLGEAWL